MKLNLNVLKSVTVNAFVRINDVFTVTNDFLKENKVTKKLLALTLTITLLLPIFLFGDWAKSAAASLSNLMPSVLQTSASNTAPPVSFEFSSSDTFPAKVGSSILMINTSVAEGFVSTVNFFTTPQLPEGFEAAKPVSPAKTLLLSIGDSFKSFFGFSSTTSNSATSPLLSPVPLGSTSFDYNNDGKADVARFRPSTGEWEIKYSGSNTVAAGMLAPGKLAPADYDGDTITDLASFNNGTWNILKSSDNQILQITGFGQSGDIPVSGNYIGTGAADLAVWRPSNGTWYVREVINTTIVSQQFGQSGDIPAPGNYDGLGYMDYAVFRPNGGVWHILGSNSGYYYAQWGIASDIPTAADFDGDGKTDMAVYRPSTGTWYSLNTNSNGGYIQESWGNYGDQPAPADYNADGKADFSVYRPTSGVWHTKKSTSGTYEFSALGTPQDMAATSAYIKQIGGQVATYDMTKTRVAPKNATGGTNFYSRNYGWSSSLVELSGRAGLDMGFGISYNSLIWTKHTDPSTNNSTMYFDVDNSNISPGFRFGFSMIEPVYYDSTTGKFSYLMISPSGARTEFKQIGASQIYETVDSSYVQLKTKGADSPNDPVESISIAVTGTDGTKMSYIWKGGAFRVSEIKDRNGNFITVNHDNYGLLQSVTDTLGRVVTVEYDSQLYPTAIKQTWKNNNGGGSTDVTHYWARFEYTTIAVNPSFNSSLGIYGPTGGAAIKVLSKIKRADESATVFEYQQNSFGQVSKIRNLAPDNHELNYLQTNLASPGTNLTDCPRLSQTKIWTENFNGGSEVVFNNDYQENQPTWGGGQGTIITTTSPDGVTPNGVVIEKAHMFGAGSGWVEALPFYSETCTSANCGGTDKKRWIVTTWTQDGTNLSYKNNPRITSTTVSDSVSSRRVEHIYSDSNEPLIARYGLTKETRLYDVYQNNKLLKSSVFNYNFTTPYLSKYIIGLPSEVQSYGEKNGTLVLASKMTYAYDEENFSQETNQNISSVIQHDNVDYSAGFIAGRANVTSMTRHDVTGLTASITSKVRYDIAGSVVAQIDPLNRKVRIEYEDSFNDTATSRNTFAYPTKLTDPANKFSEVKYRFDTGSNVWAKSPAPENNSSGKETTKLYDDFGRILKETLVNTGAYTRYDYQQNAVQLKVFTTVVDVNDEVMSESWTDGAGRIMQSRSEHPGSEGGWSATKTAYNILGQPISSTVPTEVNSGWQLAGDGLTRGWLWNSQEYDWKGRMTKSTNTDGSFSQAFYDGCGCAGGEVVTLEGEQLAEGKRKQKIYSDILGRNYKTEILNWDNTVYSTTVVKYNERDQEEWVKQFAGAAPFDALSTDSCPVQPSNEPQSCQITKMTYDGHGRLKTKHTPQQDADKSTVYDYYQTGEIHKVTDARGAVTTYNYNERGLVTEVSSNLPPPVVNPIPSPTSTNQLLSGQSLGPGQFITSPNGYYKLIYQNDGNFVLIDQHSNTAMWHADRNTSPGRAEMQNDGNLVLYNSSSSPVWHTNTNNGQSGSRLAVQNDGNVVLYRSNNAIAWSTNTYRGDEPPTNTSTTYGYDDAGNRLWMNDGLGRTDYEYDSLSRLKSETRSFTDTLPSGSPLVMANAPLPNNSFKLQYTYELAGQLKSLTDPYGAVINYDYDDAGRLDNVTGSSFGGVTNYASGAKYQAWGGLKELTYGSTLQMQMTYNNRLQAATYSLAGGSSGQVMNKQYDYYADGALRYAQDLMNPKFDRLNTYDHAGRIKEGKSGAEARGGTVQPNDQLTDLPYRQSYEYNAFGNMTQRNNRHWGKEVWYGQEFNLNYNYKNNRVQSQYALWFYDADGRTTQSSVPDEFYQHYYNAAGQMMHTRNETYHMFRWHDGNGRETKRATFDLIEYQNSTSWVMQPIKYYIRSSILNNEVVSEVWANGKKGKTFVRAAGSQLGYQSAHGTDTANLNEAVFFEYTDVSGMSQRTTNKLGAAVVTGDGGDGSPIETDPLGGNVGTSTPYTEFEQPYQPSTEYPMLQEFPGDSPMFINGQRVTCTLDGVAMGCSSVMMLMEVGGAIPIELEKYQRLPGFKFENRGLGMFTVNVPLQVGWHVNPNQTVTPVYSEFSTRTYAFAISWNSSNQKRDDWANRAADRKKLPLIDVSVLRDKVSELLTDECKAFIKDLLAKANEMLTEERNNAAKDDLKYLPQLPSEVYTDVMGLFNSVVKQGGFYGSKSANVSTIGGNIKDGTGTVYLAGFLGWNDRLNAILSLKNGTIDDARKSYNMTMSGSLQLDYKNSYALTTIHELLHFNFHDVTLANAVAAMNQNSKRFSIKNGEIMDASRYWGEELRQKCGTRK